MERERGAGQYGKCFSARVGWEVNVRNACMVEEVRVWSCGDEDGGEVGHLGFVSREKVKACRSNMAIQLPRAVQQLGARSVLPRAGGRCRRRRV